jgi:hypothetical protein
VNRRVIGTILFGLGVVFVVLAVGFRFFVAPRAANIPYDLEPSTSVVMAKNATFLQVSPAGFIIKKGDLQSTTYVVPQPVITQDKMKNDLAGKAVVWDVYSQTINVSDKSVVDASSQEIALDRGTGAAVTWDGAWQNDSNAPKGSETKVAFKGHSYKLPFGAEKKSYDFWDGTLGRTFPAEFKAEESVSGLPTYRYVSVIPLQQAPLDATSADALQSEFGGGVSGGKLMYSNTRTLWVEPTTGQFADIREQRHLEYQGGNGVKTVLLDADFRYTDDTKKKTADGISSNRTLLNLVSLYLPLILGVLGVALVVAGLMMRSPRRGEHAAY